MEHVPLKRPQFFFTTTPTPCPYLPGRLERKVVTELNGPNAEALHESLSRAGFRRSHSIAYAPACSNCNACVPARIVVSGFVLRRSFRRNFNDNADLRARRIPARATAEQYRLFTRYQEARHSGSDMAQMGFYDYRAMVEDSPIDTHMVEFRTADSALVAACLIDRVGDGLSAVYSFFDPDLRRRGLGTYMILWLVQEARRLGIPHVYLGYWIAASNKMA
ncbi:MAG: arginyltransferase, partial [Alphaproteobacteria bacterium]|nr:arginyltransferase [Alphaproteobacteria bacterium]